MDPMHLTGPSDGSCSDWFDQVFDYQSYNPNRGRQDLDRADLTTGVR